MFGAYPIQVLISWLIYIGTPTNNAQSHDTLYHSGDAGYTYNVNISVTLTMLQLKENKNVLQHR